MDMSTIRLSGLALIAAIVTACADRSRMSSPADDGESVPESERYGGTAVVASSLVLRDVNPLTRTSHLESQIGQSVLFMPLIRYDERGIHATGRAAHGKYRLRS